MYVSLFLGPNVDGPEDDRVAIELCIEQALKADEAGFAAVYVGEQHFGSPVVSVGISPPGEWWAEPCEFEHREGDQRGG
jgi:alkanesulfonate monooxygenase SsuD/methylene tetrahydromethanopterin reductase-like flavin-dependent oxidoreductase (luciferase family)